VWFEKISRRKDCDAAILNILVKLVLNSNENSASLKIALGGKTIKRVSLQFHVPQDVDK
jgi:hypothetical protein